MASERDQEDGLPTDVAPGDVLDAEDLVALDQQLEELEEDHPPWAQPAPQREPARFQISVTLKAEWVIPGTGRAGTATEIDRSYHSD